MAAGTPLPCPFDNLLELWLRLCWLVNSGSDRRGRAGHASASAGRSGHHFVNLTCPDDPVLLRPTPRIRCGRRSPRDPSALSCTGLQSSDRQQLDRHPQAPSTPQWQQVACSLHCRAGIGRTGTTIARWLVQHRVRRRSGPRAALAHKMAVVVAKTPPNCAPRKPVEQVVAARARPVTAQTRQGHRAMNPACEP